MIYVAFNFAATLLSSNTSQCCANSKQSILFFMWEASHNKNRHESPQKFFYFYLCEGKFATVGWDKIVCFSHSFVSRSLKENEIYFFSFAMT